MVSIFKMWAGFKQNFKPMILGGNASLLSLVVAVVLGAHVHAVQASEIPKDSVDSIMWEYVAKQFILSDKEGSDKIVMNDRVQVFAPKIAEDQMNIPVHVDARGIENVRKIVVIADLNPLPKVLTYRPEKAAPRLSFRIKVEQGTPIRAAVLDGKGVWHIGATYIDAAGGGCSQPAVAHSQDDWVSTLAEVRGKIWRSPAKEFATMRVTIKHPMDTGLADGIPAFYVEDLVVKTPKGQRLGRLEIHEPVSENPTLTLFPKIQGGLDHVILSGRDNEGNLIKVSVPAPVQSSHLQK